MYREQQQQQQRPPPQQQRFKKPFDNRHQHQNARHYSKRSRNNAASIRTDDFHHNHAVFQENFQHQSSNCLENAKSVAQHRQPLISNNQSLLPDLQSSNKNNNMQQTPDESRFPHNIDYIHRDSMQNFQTPQRHHNISTGPHTTKANTLGEETNNNNNANNNKNIPHSKSSINNAAGDFQANRCSTSAADHQQFDDQHYQQFDSSNYFQNNACSQRLQQNQPNHENHHHSQYLLNCNNPNEGQFASHNINGGFGQISEQISKPNHLNTAMHNNSAQNYKNDNNNNNPKIDDFKHFFDSFFLHLSQYVQAECPNCCCSFNLKYANLRPNFSDNAPFPSSSNLNDTDQLAKVPKGELHSPRQTNTPTNTAIERFPGQSDATQLFSKCSEFDLNCRNEEIKSDRGAFGAPRQNYDPNEVSVSHGVHNMQSRINENSASSNANYLRSNEDSAQMQMENRGGQKSSNFVHRDRISANSEKNWKPNDTYDIRQDLGSKNHNTSTKGLLPNPFPATKNINIGRQNPEKVEKSSNLSKQSTPNTLASNTSSMLKENGMFNNINTLADNSVQQSPRANFGTKSSVLMFYNINGEQIDCRMLYNIISLYGVVNKVKFLKTFVNMTSTAAMVELASADSIQAIIENLDQLSVFGSAFHINQSRQHTIELRSRPFALPNQTESYVDFHQLNLDKGLIQRNSNHVVNISNFNHPQKTLYISNLPSKTTCESLRGIFLSNKAPMPVKLKLLNKGSTLGALAEFSSVSEAAEAIMLSANTPLENLDYPSDSSSQLAISFSKINI